MSKLDLSRDFIPVKIAVLTISDTRSLSDDKSGDLLAVMSSGAYGFVMASNYNTRNKPAELMVDGDKVHLIRRRETISDQLMLETLISE